MDTTTFALEVRLADTADGRTVEGIAVPYGETTTLTPHGAERFRPGSMTKTLNDWGMSKRRIPVLRGHDTNTPIGKVVEWADEPDGLHVTAQLADTRHGRDAIEEVQAGILDGFSIGFRSIQAQTVAGVREVREAAWHELSLVALPAYTGARVLAHRQASTPPIPPRPHIPPRMLHP